MKFREKLSRFMYGRYGADQLSHFALWVYIALFVINLFVGSSLIYIAAMAIMFWTFFRMLSRNIYARNKENLKFLAIKKKFLSFFKLMRDRVRDARHKVYKKCPQCRAIVRLPRSAGKHSVACPACKRRFSIKIMPFWAIALINVGIVSALFAAAVLAVILL